MNSPMTTLRTFDLSPLFRQAVGFDGISHLLDSVMKLEQTAPSYPPYNIEKQTDDSYRITLAVAGFAAQDLTITAQEDVLLIAGKQAKQEGEREAAYLHRGIAARAFERRFQLADHVKVVGAKLENGLLHVDLVREVPEAAKPRTISIETAGSSQTMLDNKH